jgi:hypothetical protein
MLFQMMFGIFSINNLCRFHVSSFSSAHVYLRVSPDISELSDIPGEVLEECAQLTKWNSIEGSKRGSVKIVYTFARNLRKEKTMATGEVAFHDESKCVYMNVSTNKKLAKSLLKTKREEFPNLQSIH